MAFEEKRAWIMVVVSAAAYATYAAIIVGRVDSTPVANVPYVATMLWSIGLAIAVSIVANIAVGIASGKGAERKDPRDRETVVETVYLRDEAISTSGNYEQFFEVEGVRYAHILDPRTGRPVQGMISVSVIGSSAEETDALSTAFFVLGRADTEETCKARPNIRVIIVEESGGGDVTVSRFGFDRS